MKKHELAIKKDILAYCNDVDADLITIVSIIEYEFPNYSNIEIKKYTLQIIRELLSEGLIRSGDVTKKGNFKEWRLSVEESLKKIKKEWNRLTRELLMGDIVWFIITEKGKKEFEHLYCLPELKETDPFYFDDE